IGSGHRHQRGGRRSTVACVWEQRVGAEIDYRVLPDGCADVIVGFGGAVAVGPADTAVVHRLAAASSCRGLRLRPEAVATFFGVPAHELRNKEIPLDDAVGARRAGDLLAIVLHAAPDHSLEVDPPVEVADALRLLPMSSVDETAHALGLSSRHLQRLLLEHTGLGPKEHQRVRRLHRFLDDESQLADAAVAAGYADQSHLTREVTRLCGLPPAALRAERRRSQRAYPMPLD
ncbi:MAG: helix-turn-helix domain-containing protein, partial [Chloroflexota bacterium]|nr:helix-turn-helix domain-containing protein [Chloroflexota bacterium]